MPESEEKRELGGLAKSIDALFSQTPAVAEEEADGDADTEHQVSGVDLAYAPDTMALFDEPPAAATEPDPFESLEAVDASSGSAADEEAPSVEPAPETPGAEGVSEALPELEALPLLEPLEEPEERSEPEPELHAESEPELPGESELELHGESELELHGESELESEPEAMPVDGPPEPSAPEATGSDLAAAVDAFLAGHPGAADEVEAHATELGDRLALDPLADAVERMVLASEGDPEDPAAQMAGKIINPAVASRLVQRMAADDDPARRAEYVAIVEGLGMVMANAFKGVLTEATDARTRRACYDGLIAMGDEGRPVIEAMVEDDNSFLVQHGVAILGEMAGEGSVELVTSALANPDFRVRREALAALAKLGGEESGQLIMASLDDADVTVRAAAAEAAGQLRLERALKPILALLEDDSLSDEDKVPVQVQALRALGLLGDPGAVQAIEKRAVGSLFSKPPTEIRVAAYRALHDIGTPHAREVIEKGKQDKDPVVRTMARGFDTD